jgi:hypothetical protein
MNTLQDLRATLDQHAAEVGDDSTSARVAAVHGRARVVRRRRAAGVGAAAVLAVVATAGVPWLTGDRSPAPTDRELLGRTAPAQLTALGYTYEFERGVENRSGSSRLELDRSDEPRLISWAADSPVELVDNVKDVDLSDRVDFDDWVYVPPGSDGTWTARADATALAVYTLTDEAPAGVTLDGITYRDQVAGDRLLGAEVGEVGQDEVSVTYTVPEGDTRWAPFCTGGAADAWIHLDLGDRLGEMISGPSCDDPTFDPGGFGGSSGGHGRTGETITATLYLTDGQDGPRLSLDDVRLGLGVYETAAPTSRIGGFEPAGQVEYDGHLWEYDGADAARPGTTELDLTNSGDDVVLVEAMSSRVGRALVRVDFPGRDGRINLGAGGSTTNTLPPGERVTMSVRGDGSTGVRLAFALYERVD